MDVYIVTYNYKMATDIIGVSISLDGAKRIASDVPRIWQHDEEESLYHWYSSPYEIRQFDVVD